MEPAGAFCYGKWSRGTFSELLGIRKEEDPLSVSHDIMLECSESLDPLVKGQVRSQKVGTDGGSDHAKHWADKDER